MGSKVKWPDFRKFWNSILPGMFLIGLNIGTGSVTAMSKAGAEYGMSFLWAIALSCFITFYLVHIFGKFTIVTGHTALNAFRKYIHPVVGLFFVITLTINVAGSVMGVMGIVSEVCYEWSAQFYPGGISPVVFAVFFSGLVYGLFWLGKTSIFQHILAWIVIVLSVSFLINLFILSPSLATVLKGLIPSIPESDGNNYLVILSMVGTTVFSGLFIVRTSLVKEAGWTRDHLKVQKRDAAISASMMFLISASIMASAAGTVHVAGEHMNNVSQMLTLLEPFAGPLSIGLFVIGIVAAGVSSQFPNLMMPTILWSDFNGVSLKFDSTAVRIFVLAISMLGLVVPVFNAPPILLMILSQAFGALLLPFTVCSILYLGNKSKIMREYRFRWMTNTVLISFLFFSLLMTFKGLTEVAKMFSNHF